MSFPFSPHTLSYGTSFSVFSYYQCVPKDINTRRTLIKIVSTIFDDIENRKAERANHCATSNLTRGTQTTDGCICTEDIMSVYVMKL